jgi:hypothetical protein
MNPWAISVLVATGVVTLVLLASAFVGFFMGD